MLHATFQENAVSHCENVIHLYQKKQVVVDRIEDPIIANTVYTTELS